MPALGTDLLLIERDGVQYKLAASDLTALVKPPIRHVYVNDETTVADFNAPSAASFLLNTSRYVTLFDLAGYSQCRLQAHCSNRGVLTAYKLAVKYRAAGFSGTFGDYSDIGESEVSVTFTGNTELFSSGWVNLAAGAKANDVAVGVSSEGGDGTSDPQIGVVLIEFR